MNFKYVLDSYAWVEYFMGSQNGQIVRTHLEKDQCFTPSIVVAELFDKYAEDEKNFSETHVQFILRKTGIVNLEFETAREAGLLKHEIRKKTKSNFGLADAIVLTTAKRLEAKVVTGDHHFKQLENVEYIG